MARIWSAVNIASVLLILYGESLEPSSAQAPTRMEWVGLMRYLGGVCLRMIVG
jgi:hypothetical protein